MNNTRRIKIFIGAMMLAAAITAGYAGVVSHALHTYFALAVLVLAAVTSRMKVKLPGINGNMSVNLPFLLTAVVSLSSAEAVVVAFVSTAVQCWPRKDAKFNPQQMAFNLSMMAFASCLASLMFHAAWPWNAWRLQHPGTGPGNRHPVPGTDRSGSRDRSRQRGQGRRPHLVEPGASVFPVLRDQRRSHHHGAGRQLSPGLGTRARGLPGHVRHPPLLPCVLWTSGADSEPGTPGQSSEGRSVNGSI